MMNKKGLAPIGIIVAVVLVLVLGGVAYFAMNQPPEPPEMTVPGTPEIGTADEGKTHTVKILASGFSPATLEIMKGDTVVFVNEDSGGHWPASGRHPTHEICPGFDSLRPLATGERYSFTFTEAKECPMHDHINATAIRGKIVVK